MRTLATDILNRDPGTPLLPFIQISRPEIVTAEGPDAEGNYSFTKTTLVEQTVEVNRLVMVERVIEVEDPDTGLITEETIEEEEYQLVSEVVEVEEVVPVTEAEQISLDLIVTQHANQIAAQYVRHRVQAAIVFGNNLITEFATENILLGITQAGLTASVRKKTAEITGALSVGSLYEAIAELKAIPAEDKDPVFITDVRILGYVNQIEAYLEIPLTTAL